MVIILNVGFIQRLNFHKTKAVVHIISHMVTYAIVFLSQVRMWVWGGDLHLAKKNNHFECLNEKISLSLRRSQYIIFKRNISRECLLPKQLSLWLMIALKVHPWKNEFILCSKLAKKTKNSLDGFDKVNNLLQNCKSENRLFCCNLSLYEKWVPLTSSNMIVQ